MKFPSVFRITTLVAALVMAGCSSSERVLADIHIGDTPENVEAGLGRPNRRHKRAGARVPEIVWVYTNMPTPRPVATGWKQVIVPGASDQNGKVTRAAVTREVYRQERQDMHVVFTNGRVSYVEYFRR